MGNDRIGNHTVQHPFRRTIALLFALVLAPLAVFSAHQTHAQQTLNFSSRFYNITTDLDRPTALQIAQHMDIVYGEYRKRFAQYRARDARLDQQRQSLYVFAQQQTYLDFLNTKAIDGTGSAGMFFTRGNEAGLAAFLPRGDRDRMYQTLQHEGFHQFAAVRLGNNLPVWLNEGMAEYFGESILTGGANGTEMLGGLIPPAKLKRVQTAVQNGTYIPFDQLLNITSEDWRRNVRNGIGGLQYDQSWSIVQFLADTDPQLRQALYRYLELVADGRSSEQAFRNAFGTDRYDQFQNAWAQHVQQLQPTDIKTAEHRLTFLGFGMRFMLERGIEIESIEQIKQQLRAVRFRITQTAAPGIIIELDSADDQNFQPPPPDSGRGQPTLTLEPSPLPTPNTRSNTNPRAISPRQSPAANNTNNTQNAAPAEQTPAPPQIIVRGLTLPVRLIWEQDPEGQWSSRVVFR